MAWPYSRGWGGYMYSVFVKILLNNQEKKTLCEHLGNKYSQKVCAKLSAYALKYTKALLNSYKFITYITSDHVVDGSWFSTIEIFILNWQDQIQLYKTFVESSESFSGVQKLICWRILLTLFYLYKL